MAARARPCAARTRLFELTNLQSGALPLAPRSFAAPVFITLSVYYEELSSFHHLVKRTKKVFLPLDHRGAKGSIVCFIEYHSLCAFVCFGSPPLPFPWKIASPPLFFLFPVCIARQHSLAWAGVGGSKSPNHTTAQKLSYSIYTQYSLYDQGYEI